MSNTYQIYLISDSTGETLDRIFLSLKSQFANFEYNKKEFVFIRTEQQINKILIEEALAREKGIDIIVDLNIGKKNFTAYTMDLTKKYIEINADYRS